MQIANQVTKQPVEDVKHATEIQQPPESVETITDVAPLQEQLNGEIETTKAAETQTFQPTSAQDDDTTTTQQQAQVQTINVVDNTNEITTLHTLADNVQKLTTIADQDEAKFISGVEQAHGHK